MILPTKRIHQNRALITVGAEVLRRLNEPKTVSKLWDEIQKAYRGRVSVPTLTYDWFILSLDLLFALNTIHLNDGLIAKAKQRK
jgi:hypothetical protein